MKHPKVNHSKIQDKWSKIEKQGISYFTQTYIPNRVPKALRHWMELPKKRYDYSKLVAGNIEPELEIDKILDVGIEDFIHPEIVNEDDQNIEFEDFEIPAPQELDQDLLIERDDEDSKAKKIKLSEDENLDPTISFDDGIELEPLIEAPEISEVQDIEIPEEETAENTSITLKNMFASRKSINLKQIAGVMSYLMRLEF